MGSGSGGRFGFFLRGRRLRAWTRRLAGAWARRLAVRERRQTFWLRVTQRLGLAHCGMLTLGTHPGPHGLCALAVKPTTTAALLWRHYLCVTQDWSSDVVNSLTWMEGIANHLHYSTVLYRPNTCSLDVHKLCFWKVNNLINRIVGSKKFGFWDPFSNETTRLANWLSVRRICSFSTKRTPKCINQGISKTSTETVTELPT